MEVIKCHKRNMLRNVRGKQMLPMISLDVNLE